MINYWRSRVMKDVDDESPLNKVRLLLDCRSYLWWRADMKNVMRLINEVRYIPSVIYSMAFEMNLYTQCAYIRNSRVPPFK